LYQFTDTKVFCHFTFRDDDGILLYGFVLSDDYGKEKDVVTKMQYADSLGNIRLEKEASGSMWNMTTKSDLDSFFISSLHSALKQAFKYRLGSASP